MNCKKLIYLVLLLIVVLTSCTSRSETIATNVFDLQEPTVWHTSYSVNKDKFPHQIIIDLGETKAIGGFEYLPRMEELRPETPLMCSEFWSGWFDHWGAKHETRSAEELVSGMKAMLERNISFSLYMTHGGTSFGHWAGSNFPAYVPNCTSYDYDAPISESGRQIAIKNMEVALSKLKHHNEIYNDLNQYLCMGKVRQAVAPINVQRARLNLLFRQ
jgi:hypothetical protein